MAMWASADICIDVEAPPWLAGLSPPDPQPKTRPIVPRAITGFMVPPRLIRHIVEWRHSPVVPAAPKAGGPDRWAVEPSRPPHAALWGSTGFVPHWLPTAEPPFLTAGPPDRPTSLKSNNSASLQGSYPPAQSSHPTRILPGPGCP